MPEREWKIKTDIVEDAKELPKEELKKQKRHQVFQQKQGSGNRTPGSTKFTTEKHELDHMEDNTKAEHDLDRMPSSSSRKVLEKNLNQTNKQRDMHMEMYMSPSAALDTIEDREPEVDAYRGILLVQKATAVTGQNQIGRLEMKSRKKTIVIKLSLHTDKMDREFALVEPLKEDGTVALV